MYYMIYHITYHEDPKQYKIVGEKEHDELLKSGEWFDNVQDARKSFDAVVEKLEKKSTKRVNKNNNVK